MSSENPIFNRIKKVPRNGGFWQEGYRVWGSSVVQGDDGRYHMFVSRVPDYMRFHPGWMIASEIVRASSDTPEGPYKFKEVVLPSRGAEYWDGRSTHNPRLIKVGNKYVLFYMGSTHPFEDITPDNAELLTPDCAWCTVGRSNKRIGIAVSDSVEGPWKRFDEPVLKTKPGTYYSFLTSNPAPTVGPDGRIYMIFKSRQYVGHKHSSMNLGLAVADSLDTPFRVVTDSPLFSTNNIGQVEDPFLWADQSGFHILAKDHGGTITSEAGVGILAHSDDCLNWTLDPAPKAYSRTITWDDGTTETFGNMERVSGLVDDQGNLTHLFFAVWKGEKTNVASAEAKAWNIVMPLADL